jgi:hypothetical protein
VRAQQHLHIVAVEIFSAAIPYIYYMSVTLHPPADKYNRNLSFSSYGVRRR